MGAMFARVIPMIVALEGDQYNDRPSDYGGPSKYGISQRQFPEVDIKNLSESEAMTLIERHYWQPFRLMEIHDQTIASQILLLVMNMNPIKAGRIIQLALNISGRGILNVKVDGVIGSETISALNSLNPLALSDSIRVQACKYYLKETDEDAKQIPNFRGWIRRALA